MYPVEKLYKPEEKETISSNRTKTPNFDLDKIIKLVYEFEHQKEIKWIIPISIEIGELNGDLNPQFILIAYDTIKKRTIKLAIKNIFCMGVSEK